MKFLVSILCIVCFSLVAGSVVAQSNNGQGKPEEVITVKQTKSLEAHNPANPKVHQQENGQGQANTTGNGTVAEGKKIKPEHEKMQVSGSNNANRPVFVNTGNPEQDKANYRAVKKTFEDSQNNGNGSGNGNQ